MRGVKADVIDAEAPPGLEADALPCPRRNLAKDLGGQVAAPLGAVLRGARLLVVVPDLGQEGSREIVVVLEEVLEVGRQIARSDGPRRQLLGDEGAQAEATRVVSHPAGLERGFLAAVGEHQEPLALREVDHALREDMDIGDVLGTHRPGRLAVLPEARAAAGAAAHARHEPSRTLLVAGDHVELYQRVARAAAVAPLSRRRVQSPAVPT